MKSIGIQVIDHNDQGNVLDLKINPIKDAFGKIISGLVIDNILPQNKAFLLIAQPGDLKANPMLGVGFEDILLSDELLEYRHKIREQFALDGLKVTNLDVYSNRAVNIEAYYE